MTKFTIPISYSGQDFDEIQARANIITEEERKAGRQAPPYGYSEEALIQAKKEYCAKREIYLR